MSTSGGPATTAGADNVVSTGIPETVIGVMSSGTMASRLIAANFSGDGNSGAAYLSVASWAFNGSLFDRVRVPVVFKELDVAAAGATALWTPAAGKKFRLMYFVYSLSDNASLAVAGQDTIRLQDGATNIAGTLWRPFVPGAAAAVVGAASLPAIVMGNGFLSAAANNVLNVNVGTVLATGSLTVLVGGTEE